MNNIANSYSKNLFFQPRFIRMVQFLFNDAVAQMVVSTTTSKFLETLEERTNGSNKNNWLKSMTKLSYHVFFVVLTNGLWTMTSSHHDFLRGLTNILGFSAHKIHDKTGRPELCGRRASPRSRSRGHPVDPTTFGICWELFKNKLSFFSCPWWRFPLFFFVQPLYYTVFMSFSIDYII